MGLKMYLLAEIILKSLFLFYFVTVYVAKGGGPINSLRSTAGLEPEPAQPEAEIWEGNWKLST